MPAPHRVQEKPRPVQDGRSGELSFEVHETLNKLLVVLLLVVLVGGGGFGVAQVVGGGSWLHLWAFPVSFVLVVGLVKSALTFQRRHGMRGFDERNRSARHRHRHR